MSWSRGGRRLCGLSSVLYLADGGVSRMLRLGADGEPLGDSESVNAAWRALFLQEFRGIGQTLQPDDPFFDEEPSALPGAGSPMSEAAWEVAVGDVAAALKFGKAPGPDLVPPELLRVGGPGCWRILAHLAFEVACRGLPHCWRGGVMVPVPKPRILPRRRLGR